MDLLAEQALRQRWLADLLFPALLHLRLVGVGQMRPSTQRRPAGNHAAARPATGMAGGDRTAVAADRLADGPLYRRSTALRRRRGDGDEHRGAMVSGQKVI